MRIRIIKSIKKLKTRQLNSFWMSVFVLYFFTSCSYNNESQDKIEEVLIPNILLELNDVDFKQKQGVFYHNNKPYSGYIYEKYDNDSLKRRSSYKNGKLVNWSRGWFPNGKLKYEKFYLNGKKQGVHYGWWSTGNPKYIYKYENDLFEGYQVRYFKNGHLNYEKNYAKGHEQGQQKSWNEKGKLTSNYTFKNNKRFGIVGRKDCVTVFKANEN